MVAHQLARWDNFDTFPPKTVNLATILVTSLVDMTPLDPPPPPARRVFSYQTVELAKAEAENIKLIGTAEAVSIEAVGRADAERMRMKAAAYRQYGDAAMVSMVLQALPKVRTGCRLVTGRDYTWELSRHQGQADLGCDASNVSAYTCICCRHLKKSGILQNS